MKPLCLPPTVKRPPWVTAFTKRVAYLIPSFSVCACAGCPTASDFKCIFWSLYLNLLHRFQNTFPCKVWQKSRFLFLPICFLQRLKFRKNTPNANLIKYHLKLPLFVFTDEDAECCMLLFRGCLTRNCSLGFYSLSKISVILKCLNLNVSSWLKGGGHHMYKVKCSVLHLITILYVLTHQNYYFF